MFPRRFSWSERITSASKPALIMSRNTLSPALQRSNDMTTPSSTVWRTASGVASWPK